MKELFKDTEFKYEDVIDFKQQLADKAGITIEELNAMSEKDLERQHQPARTLSHAELILVWDYFSKAVGAPNFCDYPDFTAEEVAYCHLHIFGNASFEDYILNYYPKYKTEEKTARRISLEIVNIYDRRGVRDLGTNILSDDKLDPVHVKYYKKGCFGRTLTEAGEEVLKVGLTKCAIPNIDDAENFRKEYKIK